MGDMSEPKTVALRAVVGFHGLSQNDVIHVDPADPHYAGLLDGGFLAYAYPEDDPDAQATILQVDTRGEETTILGVRPARARRRRSEEDSDGTPDPESA
jgi:hypothetical protein